MVKFIILTFVFINQNTMDIYKKQHTYLVIENKTNEYVRWTSDKAIFFAGSVEDALVGLPKDEFRAIAVCDAPMDIQKEYEEAIQKAIKNGEIDVKGLIPKEHPIGVYYYFDDEGKPQFDVEEMRSEFEAFLVELEKLSQ